MIVILLTIVRKITIIISKEEQNVQSIKKKERYFMHMNYVKEEDGWIFGECSECNMIMKFRKNTLRYEAKMGTYFFEEDVQCFCGAVHKFIAYAPIEKKENNIAGLNYSTPARNVPHCPTCGSENVTKISLGSKAVGGAMFGIFSSNRRKSYKCNNCGYKW